MRYVLYNNNGDIVMNERNLGVLVNWIYEHGEGFIEDENGNMIEC